jgi:hypothetical protein
MESPEHQRRDVVRYFEMEHGEAKVQHAEKIASERIYGRPHDVWDIQSTDGKWWVITNLTNLYRQADFPSVDYVISFHVGLMARLTARQSREANVSDEHLNVATAAWRQYEQAGEALNEADEAEEFQAVGMRCRQALLSFVRATTSQEMVPDGEDRPKSGDFIHWSEHIANAVARGASEAAYRAYLKKTAKATWDLANWLTHAEGATRFDGFAVLDATAHVMSMFSDAVLRYREGIPDRCPNCSSYRLYSDYRPEVGAEGAHVTLCEVCDWESEPRPVEPIRRPLKVVNGQAQSTSA